MRSPHRSSEPALERIESTLSGDRPDLVVQEIRQWVDQVHESVSRGEAGPETIERYARETRRIRDVLEQRKRSTLEELGRLRERRRDRRTGGSPSWLDVRK